MLFLGAPPEKMGSFLYNFIKLYKKIIVQNTVFYGRREKRALYFMDTE
jgi:hypothetical protein